MLEYHPPRLSFPGLLFCKILQNSVAHCWVLQKKLTAIYQSCISFYHLVISTPCHIQMDILSILAEEVNLAWAFSHRDLTGGYNLEKI